MSDNSHCFKVGDEVTPATDDVPRCPINTYYIVTNIERSRCNEVGMLIHMEGVGGGGYDPRHFKLGKNHIVHQILKDL